MSYKSILVNIDIDGPIVPIVKAAVDLAGRYDERFRRMWRYYLSSFAAFFRARRISLWQVVLSPRGVRGGYRSIR